ncbi:MAG: PfkB family carbohydrate kinase, partial [Cyclobacteriaceae bacterium]
MNQSIVVIGSSNIDMIAQVSHFPKPGETVGDATYSQAYGGKGANQAVAAARAGGQVTFISSEGNDLFGKTMLSNFSDEGMNTDYITQSDQYPSGTALILVNREGENCIAVAPGANGQLSPQLIDQARIAISGAEIILLQLEIPLETVAYVVDL